MGAPGRGEAAVQRVGGLEFFDGWAGGNCGEVSSTDGKEFEIRLRPDTGSPRHRLWFHFRVRGAACAGRVILSIVNMSKQRSLFKDAGMSPATRRSEGAGSGASPRPWGAWGRVPSKDCYFYRSHRHGGAWKLSFVVTFETDFDEREFAYSFPYPYREGLLPWLAQLERGGLPFFRREQLCLTPLGHRADLVTIAEPLPDWSRPPRQGGRGARPRRVVFVTARVHPGETPASHVTHGLMAYLLSEDPDARLLRRHAVFVFVPMLNPDGVEAGNYRTDSNGSDLNRMWQNPSAEEEPTLWHTKRAVLEITRNENFSLDFFIDVHSHSTSRRSFVFYNPVHPSKLLAYGQMDRTLRLPKLLAKNMRDEFSLAACRCESEASKSGCARQVFGREAPSALSYTFEVSFFHAPDVAEKGEAVDWGTATQPAAHPELNTPQNYGEMGAKIGRSFSDFYKEELSRPKNEAPPRGRDARWNSSTRTQDLNLASARRNSHGGGASGRGGGGLLQGRAAGGGGGGRLPASETDFTSPPPSGAATRHPPRSSSKSLSPNSPPFAGGAPLRKCVSEVQMTFKETARARWTPSLDDLGRAAGRQAAGAQGWGRGGTEEASVAEPQQARSSPADYRQVSAGGSDRAPPVVVKRKKAVADRPRLADMTVTSSHQGPRDASKTGATGRGVQLPLVKKSKPLDAPTGASGPGATCRLLPYHERLTKEEVHGQALMNQWGVDIRHPYRVQKPALPVGFKASALPRARD